MKKVKTEKELQFEAKMKELDRKEKATRKENKVKYGPGRRGVLIIVTSVLCIGIAVLGVYFVQQLLKDDKYTGGNEVVTTVTTTTTAVSVPTGVGTTSPVEIYPDDENAGNPDLDGDGNPDKDNDPIENEDDPIGGGFGYNDIDTPKTSATTTISGSNIQITTSGGGRDEDGITIGMGGGHGEEDGYPSTTKGTTNTSASTSSNQATAATTSNTTRPAQTTAVTPSVTTTTTVRTNASTASSTRKTLPTGNIYVDPSETLGNIGHDYIE